MSRGFVQLRGRKKRLLDSKLQSNDDVIRKLCNHSSDWLVNLISSPLFFDRWTNHPDATAVFSWLASFLLEILCLRECDFVIFWHISILASRR